MKWKPSKWRPCKLRPGKQRSGWVFGLMSKGCMKTHQQVQLMLKQAPTEITVPHSITNISLSLLGGNCNSNDERSSSSTPCHLCMASVHVGIRVLRSTFTVHPWTVNFVDPLGFSVGGKCSMSGRGGGGGGGGGLFG